MSPGNDLTRHYSKEPSFKSQIPSTVTFYKNYPSLHKVPELYTHTCILSIHIQGKWIRPIHARNKSFHTGEGSATNCRRWTDSLWFIYSPLAESFPSSREAFTATLYDKVKHRIWMHSDRLNPIPRLHIPFGSELTDKSTRTSDGDSDDIVRQWNCANISLNENIGSIDTLLLNYDSPIPICRANRFPYNLIKNWSDDGKEPSQCAAVNLVLRMRQQLIN